MIKTIEIEGQRQNLRSQRQYLEAQRRNFVNRTESAISSLRELAAISHRKLKEFGSRHERGLLFVAGACTFGCLVSMAIGWEVLASVLAVCVAIASCVANMDYPEGSIG